MFGEIKFFVGLQVYQIKYGIYITQSKYLKEILKTFGLEDSKLVSTPMVTRNRLSNNDNSTDVNKKLYMLHPNFSPNFKLAHNRWI